MDQQTKDVFFIVVVNTGLIVFFVVMLINLLLFLRNRKLRHIAEVQELKIAFEKELLTTRLEVTESTLAEVSGDLHDDVGQMLTVAILELNRLEGAEDAKIAVKSSLDSVRAISRSLSPDFVMAMGLKDVLLRLAERLNRKRENFLKINFDENVTWADQNHELYVYRILQELVTNTLKYAEASEVNINIYCDAGSNIIRYSDNGKGLGDVENGVGMLNINRRVQVLHGTIQIDSKPGKGFAATLQFPKS